MKKVVVTGGGTAGWLTAAALAQQFGALLDITLVESEEIGTVGVGEATFPSIHASTACSSSTSKSSCAPRKASFKLGISFENWGGLGDRYIHAFGTIGRSTWMGDFQHFWLAAQEEGFGGDLGDYCFERQAALAGKFAMSDKVKINYAYHLDAGLYAALSAAALASRRASNASRARSAHVEQDPENGFITRAGARVGRTRAGDLFVDCSGISRRC